MKRSGLIAGVVVVLLAVAGLAWYATRDDSAPESKRSSSGSAEPSAESNGAAGSTPRSSAKSCDRAKPFTPETIIVRGVTDARPVVTVPRDANGVPGIPPLTDAGKTIYAFDPDQDVLPGDPHGNVLLNAHTWPDGSGLGNKLLAGVQPGSKIVVTGQGRRLCYHVTSRVEVDASKPQPKYYARKGRPQLAIVVCSGERLGPGEWTKRTIWYASPGV